MAVVNEQAAFKANINNCKDLANHLVRAIDSKSCGYVCSYVVCDKYNVKSSLKDSTRKRRTGGKSSYVVNYKIDDNTKINDFATFLSSTKTKDLLTLYPAEQLIEHCTSSVTTVTRLTVLSSQPVTDVVDLRSIHEEHEEVDTLPLWQRNSQRWYTHPYIYICFRHRCIHSC